MNNDNLSSKEIEVINKLQIEKDNSEHYRERPKYQRVLAWILLVIVVIGIILYCRIQMVPQI